MIPIWMITRSVFEAAEAERERERTGSVLLLMATTRRCQSSVCGESKYGGEEEEGHDFSVLSCCCQITC